MPEAGLNATKRKLTVLFSGGGGEEGFEGTRRGRGVGGGQPISVELKGKREVFRQCQVFLSRQKRSSILSSGKEIGGGENHRGTLGQAQRQGNDRQPGMYGAKKVRRERDEAVKSVYFVGGKGKIVRKGPGRLRLLIV